MSRECRPYFVSAAASASAQLCPGGRQEHAGSYDCSNLPAFGRREYGSPVEDTASSMVSSKRQRIEGYVRVWAERLADLLEGFGAAICAEIRYGKESAVTRAHAHGVLIPASSSIFGEVLFARQRPSSRERWARRWLPQALRIERIRSAPARRLRSVREKRGSTSQPPKLARFGANLQLPESRYPCGGARRPYGFSRRLSRLPSRRSWQADVAPAP